MKSMFAHLREKQEAAKAKSSGARAPKFLQPGLIRRLYLRLWWTVNGA